MNSQIQISNATSVCHIEIEGIIGVPEAWQFDHPDSRVATYERFREAVRRIAEIKAPEVVVEIRSTGGDVNDALLIHDALRSLDARIITRCYGYTASAATIIAQAASEGCREISANALYLIHNAVCATDGNAAELTEKIELLRQTDARIAAIYAERSGRPTAEFETLMAENNGNGRWLSPEEVLAAGLADRLIDNEQGASSQPENRAEVPCDKQPSFAMRMRHRWQQLLDRIGIGSTVAQPLASQTVEGDLGRELPEDRNILHFDEDIRALQRRSSIVSDEILFRIKPTTMLPREDPSLGKIIFSANEQAYARDAQAFRAN
ncbi:MAG: Clp protease ClpP [Rikenellaceae bacterium]|nr:Clp protease ClpP [Rikenellaceae bacterium]